MMFAGESHRVSRIIPRRDERDPLHIRIPCTFFPVFSPPLFCTWPVLADHFGVNICSMLARGLRHANLILRMWMRNDFSRHRALFAKNQITPLLCSSLLDFSLFFYHSLSFNWVARKSLLSWRKIECSMGVVEKLL